jgi:uncharacterized RDD family membrane protein YckC
VDVRRQGKEAPRSMPVSNLYQYPTVVRRYMATLIDGAFLLALLPLTDSLVPERSSETIHMMRVAGVALVAVVYEPLLVARGCTLGQWLCGIRVRRDTNYNARISIPSAYLRWLLKVLLGFVSLFAIPFSSRQRAVHDFVVDSVVIRVRHGTRGNDRRGCESCTSRPADTAEFSSGRARRRARLKTGVRLAS